MWFKRDHIRRRKERTLPTKHEKWLKSHEKNQREEMKWSLQKLKIKKRCLAREL
jgi:hypothetical protein